MSPASPAFAAPAPIVPARQPPTVPSLSRRTPPVHRRRTITRAVASREPKIQSATDSALVKKANGAVDTSLSSIQTLEDVQEIADLANEFGLSDLRVEDHGVAVEISRPGGAGFEDGDLVRGVSAPVPAAAVRTVETQSPVENGRNMHTGVEPAHKVMARKDDPAPALKKDKAVEKTEEKADPEKVYESDFIVKSNRVGFFYSGAKNKPPLVNVGDHVDFNQPVCIIEQLGQQYVYLTEASGTVHTIFVEDGDPVEYDQHVMVIRPD